MTYNSDELVQYLSLSNLTQLRYVIDTDALEVFQVTPGEKRVLYEGNLSGWLLRACGEEGGVRSKKTEAFCRDMQEGTASFQYEFRVKETRYSVRCKTESAPSGGRVCYGIVESLGAPSELSFRRASDKDAMLDMLNKKAITEYAKHRLSHPELASYLVILDLDNFKMVNDTYGHMFGDTVLVAFTEIINKAMGKHGVVGRLGGDEILVVTKDIPNKAALRPFLREIRTNVELAYKGKLDGISLTCSMGAAAYPEHAASYEDTMRLADKMLYLAKEKGRNRYLIYTPELHQDYVNSNLHEAPGPKKPIKQYNNIGILQYMLSEYLIKQASCNDYVFDQIGRSFRLSEVLCIYNHGNIGFRWTSEGEGLRPEDMEFLDVEDPFLDQVDENGLYLMDGRYLIQDDFPQLYEKLAARKIEAAIFYRMMKDGKPDGYVLYAKRHQRQKWSEYETIALAVTAKIFEISSIG
ncbi:MAG: GGDEF domain-containing protein [Faecousia sp.]